MRRYFVLFLMFTAALGCSSKISQQTQNLDSKEAYVQGEGIRALYGRVESSEISSYLAQLTARLWAARPNTSIEVRRPSVEVLASREPVAFAPGDGSILLSAGLISSLESEGQLGFVIAHEMGHIVLHHQDMVNEEAKYSEARRELEIAADSVGLGILTRAGYDPLEAIDGLTQSYQSLAKISPEISILSIKNREAEYPTFEARYESLSKAIGSRPTAHLSRIRKREFQIVRKALSNVR